MNQASAASLRFEYGRHETFPVRHGWLGKGLAHVSETGSFHPNLETADALGLGSRMAKSLQFWLEASGLAKAGLKAAKNGVKGQSKQKDWCITDLGMAVTHSDLYLEYPITWWFVHMALARRERSVWGWFFNDFHERHFTRETCVSAFRDYVAERAANQPSAAVAERDVACLLQAYTVPSAGAVVDPEDGSACPLRDLGLVIRHSEVSRFEKARPLDAVPVEAFLACVSTLARQLGADSVAFADMMRQRNGASRIFGLGSDQVEAMAEAAADIYWHQGVQITLLGAERHLVLPKISTSGWFDAHFRRIRALA